MRTTKYLRSEYDEKLIARLEQAYHLLSSAYAHLESGQKAKAERLRDASRDVKRGLE